LAFTAVLLLAPQNHVPALGKIRIALLTVGVAIAAHAYRCFATGRPLAHLRRELVFATLLAVWAVATVPFSYWPGGSLDLLLGVYFKSLALFWLLTSVIDTPERLRRTCAALVLLTAPLSYVALRNFASGAYIAGAVERRIVGYEAALTQNPNDLALMLNLVVPLGIALLLSVSGLATRLALLAVVGLSVAAVIVTFSRAGFVTLATTASFYAVKLIRRGAWGAAAAGLVLVLFALPFAPSGYGDRLATILDSESDPTGSSQARSRDFAAAARFIADHPLLGAGAGMNVLALNEIRGPFWTQVHSVYLEYAADLGIPGLVLFLCLGASCLGAARSAMRAFASRPEQRGLFLLSEGILVSLIAFAVAAIFHPVGYQFYFFYLGGLAVAARACAEAPWSRA
jgi:O-antigen ligase